MLRNLRGDIGKLSDGNRLIAFIGQQEGQFIPDYRIIFNNHNFLHLYTCFFWKKSTLSDTRYAAH